MKFTKPGVIHAVSDKSTIKKLIIRNKHTKQKGKCSRCIIPGPRRLQNICPLVWVKEFGSETGSKICIGEVRRIVFFHKFDNVTTAVSPVVPEPFVAESRHGVYSPRNENAKFSIIEPLR